MLKFWKRKSGLVTAAVIGAGAVTSSALAGGPPTMEPVQFPVDVGSVGSAIATAGGTILLTVFGVAISFALARKLMARLKRAV